MSLKQLAQVARVKRYPPNALIVREGDQVDPLRVVQILHRGEVKASKRNELTPFEKSLNTTKFARSVRSVVDNSGLTDAYVRWLCLLLFVLLFLLLSSPSCCCVAVCLLNAPLSWCRDLLDPWGDHASAARSPTLPPLARSMLSSWSGRSLGAASAAAGSDADSVSSADDREAVPESTISPLTTLRRTCGTKATALPLDTTTSTLPAVYIKSIMQDGEAALRMPPEPVDFVVFTPGAALTSSAELTLAGERLKAEERVVAGSNLPKYRCTLSAVTAVEILEFSRTSLQSKLSRACVAAAGCFWATPLSSLTHRCVVRAGTCLACGRCCTTT